MVHAGLEERVRDSRYPGPPLPPSWYGAEDRWAAWGGVVRHRTRWPAWGGVVRHRTLLRWAAVIAALALAATSVAPVRAQTRYYVLFPAGEQPASPKNEVGFPDGSSSSTYQVRGAQSGEAITPIADSLLDAVFLDGNTKIRVTPQSVTPAAFAAVYGATGGVGVDVEVDAGVFEGASTSADLLFIVAVRYDASARFTNAQPINSQRWGTPQIEIYEGATEDPALAFAWAAHGAGTRNWATGNPASAYRCVVGGDAVTFSAWPSSAGEDSTLFDVRPTSTSAASGNGRLNVRAAPDYENPTDSGGDNLYRVRVRNGHNLNHIFGEGVRNGCDGSALELTVRVKDAGPPAPVRSLTGSLDSDTMTIAVDWTAPAGFLDGSDSSVVVPFNTARMSGSGIPGTAVVGYDYEYRLEGSSTWTQGTTTSTSFEITGVGASDAYRVQVRARNAEGAGAFTTIDAPRQLEEPNQPPSVSASCHPCTVVPGGEVRLTATASDPDDDDLTYAWTASQGAFSGGTDAAATRWTAPEVSGRVTIRVEVSDNQGDSASATVAVTVGVVTIEPPPNGPPSVWASCHPCEVSQLGEVELTATASDPDGDELTYAWSAPAGIFSGVADAATTRWTAPDLPGPVTIRVEVTDGYGGSASAEVTIEVVTIEPPNGSPSVWASCDPCEVPRLGEVELTATAADPDGDQLTYAWSAPAGTFSGAADAATARWTAPDSLGPVTVRVEVTDGYGGSASAEVTIEVENELPGVSVSCDPCDVPRLGEVELTATASDPDGDELTYAWSAPAGTFSGVADAATARWTAPDSLGPVTVRVEVTDGHGGSASAEVTIEVENELPGVSGSCDPCEVPRLGEVELTATASDPDGDELTYAWSAPAGSFSGAADAATARWTAPDSLGPVTIRVEVTDGHGGSASAEVTVGVTNRPPAFESSEHALELRENLDGSRQPVGLGTVAASDPDGDALTYELASGDLERFAVGSGDGAVRYVGPGEDFELEPNRYELTLLAQDPHGGSAEALVVVTVVDVNEPPALEDDEAATDEDRAVTVDVLANDTDPDGDRLRVESVSAAAHGTATVTGGGVLYAPEPNYHGMDRFTYAVSDGNGGTAEAAVEVTVAPVNDAPEPVGAIPDQMLDEGGGEATVELGPFFEDIEGDALTFRASSSDPQVAAVTVAGAVLTLTPVVYGSAAVTVTAEDAGGLSAALSFAVGVGDRLVREVVGDTLAGMARSHLSSARMMLGRRASSGRREASRVTVLGRRMPLGGESARTAARQMAEQMLWGWLPAAPGGVGGAAGLGAGPLGGFGAAGLGAGPLGGFGAAGLGAGPLGGFGAAGVGSGSGAMSGAAGGLGLAGPGGVGAAGALGGLGPGNLGNPGGFGSHGGSGMAVPPGGPGSLAGGLRSVVGFGGGADPLRASAFLLSLGGGEDGDETEPGRRWQVWGQGDVQSFQGAPSEAAGYDGGLGTGYVGVDTWMTERWLAGVAAARSRGFGNWRTGGSQGSLATRLTAVHPYVGWSDGTTAVWATAGGGRGEAENVRGNGRVGTSGLGLWLGLVEVERRLVESDRQGPQFGVRADAAWAELRTGAGDESIDNQRAAVSQVRLGAEVSWPLRLGAVSLAPFGEAHARHDDGGGQTGDGLEVAGGLRLAAGRVRVDVQGRMLAVHSAAGYRERGAGLTLSVGNRSREGLSLSVSPRWGDAAAGGGALWQDQVYRQYVRDAARGEWGTDARGSYGMRMPGGGLLTWFGSFSHSLFGRRFEFGGRVGVLD